jgi:hypothetical protein
MADFPPAPTTAAISRNPEPDIQTAHLLVK